MSDGVKSVVGRLSPRLSSGRTALFLYVLLVVLPAVVFGGLLMRQLRADQLRELEALPAACNHAARRLAEGCANRVLDEIEFQQGRDFEIYRPVVFRDEVGPINFEPSPLLSGPLRQGLLGHFAFRALGYEATGSEDEVEIDVFRGDVGNPDDGFDPIALAIEEHVREELVPEYATLMYPASKELESARNEGWGYTRKRRLRTIVLNVAEGPVEECRQALDEDPTILEDKSHEIYISHFDYRVARLEDGSPPLLLAYRRVVIPQFPIPGAPTCLEAINSDVMFVQGIAFDPGWLFDAMPSRVASQVLGPSLQFRAPGTRLLDDADIMYPAAANLLAYLGTLVYDQPEDIVLGTMYVVGDVGKTRERHAVQNAWFGGVAFILAISMAIGIRLLLSSIRRSRAETERTRNFVASVTHELRTPIAAVKLYGEMLSDGWIQDEARRTEYLQRIVAESDRLDGLVDRVLLRRRLSDSDHTPSPGDLNAEIEQLRPGLTMVGGREADDIEFDLAEGLPKVLLLPEGVHVVLTNLVENARKYAPVGAGANGNGVAPEKILVRTRTSKKGRVLLEVLDRGPGIPEEDREKVFQAFLRLGDEATRKTKGTGLGLHLVALQARAMRAKVRALPREGGGTVFQVTFAKG